MVPTKILWVILLAMHEDLHEISSQPGEKDKMISIMQNIADYCIFPIFRVFFRLYFPSWLPLIPMHGTTRSFPSVTLMGTVTLSL